MPSLLPDLSFTYSEFPLPLGTTLPRYLRDTGKLPHAVRIAEK